MAASMLVAFWIMSISLVLTPGADWAYAISAGLRERAIMPAVTGMLSGYLMITMVVAAGVGAVIASFPGLLSVMTVMGAAYLMWLGVNVLVTPPAVTTTAGQQSGNGLHWIMRGFAISGANPKALLLFLALLPQFTSAQAAWPISTQMLVLGLVQMANCAVIYTFVGLGSKFILRTRPNVARGVTRFSGVAMITIACLLIVEQVLQHMG